MAAATVTAAEANVNLVRKLLERVANQRSTGYDRAGITAPIVFTVSLPITSFDDAGDKVRLCYIPAGYFIADLAIRWAAAGDIHATPTLVSDVILEEEDGTEGDIKLIGGSTSGQAADAGDRIDDAAVGIFAGERYLVIKTTTAAATDPAAAVNLRVWLVLSFGALVEGEQRIPFTREV